MIMPYGQDDYYRNYYGGYGEDWDHFFLKKLIDKRKAKRAANPKVIARKEKKTEKRGTTTASTPALASPIAKTLSAPKKIIPMVSEKMPPVVTTNVENKKTTVTEAGTETEETNIPSKGGITSKQIYAGIGVAILLGLMVTAAVWARGGQGSPEAQLKAAA